MKRPGTMHVKEVKTSSEKVRLIEFEFSTTQAYILEFGDQYIRVYKDHAIITDSNQTITGATQANPVVVTTGTHGWSNGDEIQITNVSGMTELNGKFFKIANVTGTTFELQDLDGNNIDGSAYTAYSSGGDADKVMEITTSYLEAELFDIKFTQSADILYLVHPNHEPQELTRTAHTSWTIGDFPFEDGPYMDTNTESTTLTPSAATGAGITITASATTGINNGDGFKSTDVGRWIRLKNPTNWGWALIVGFTSTTQVTADVYSDFDGTAASATWRLGKWSDTTGWPSCISFHENRLVFGGVDDFPQDIDASNSGDYPNFSPSATDGSITDSHSLSFTFNASGVKIICWYS
jgi:hypothetical protein